MKEKPKNRNGLKSKEKIKEVFLELMQTKKADEITVSEIVKKADLNRSTFYAHYYDVFDIVNEIQNDVINELNHLINDLDLKKVQDEDYKIIDEVSSYLLKNKDLFKICILTQDVLPFFEELITIFTTSLLKNPSIINIKEDINTKKTRISFISGGIVFTYIKWFKDDIKSDINELSEIIKEQIKNSLSY